MKPYRLPFILIPITIVAIAIGIMYSWLSGDAGIGASVENQVPEENPKSIETLMLRGEQRGFRCGEYSVAEEDYRRAVLLDPNSADAHYGLGTMLRLQGKNDEAIVELKKALELDSNHSEAACELGYAYYHKGEFEKALIYLKRAVELDPDAPRPKMYILRAKSRLEDKK